MRMPQRLTIVDDGSASLRLPSALRSQRALSRDGAASAIAALASSRLRSLDDADDLELFSYYDLDHPALVENRFTWLTSREAVGAMSGTVVLGTASVVDELLDEGDFLRWLSTQPVGAAYLPHRREGAATLAAARDFGLEVIETGLPVELSLLGCRDLDIRTLPSSAADTLRIVLAEGGSRIHVDSPLAVAA